MNAKSRFAGLKDLLKTPGLAELGPGPRAGVMPLAELSAALDKLLKGGKSEDLVRGLVLLWHDHFEPAHEVTQAIENPDGSLLHAILHRREPDFGNAAYWFRRAGRHKSFKEIAMRAAELLKHEQAIETLLIRSGEWDPYGFISLCEKSSAKNARDPAAQLLREIQGIETEVLLEEWSV